MNYQTLLMMLADAPRYIDAEQSNVIKNKETNKQPKSVIGFFQSKLNDDGQ
ncbi:hypothetical protein [Prevotella falsenii]|uniref:hypothetical protein n=1 Tax=Prevotella falsenii TaxID=515414 RepID=UPI0018DD5C7B|nr:hypothetical protein [Prevotella falsenii]